MPGSRLGLAEREEIRAGIERGESVRAIASGLGRAASTVCRELARNGGREGYRPSAAQTRADRLAARPRPRLLSDTGLCQRVGELLDLGWPPGPVSHHLRSEGIRISAETIYRELHRRDGWLGPDRRRKLPRPRPHRKPRTRTHRDPRPLGDYRPLSSLTPDQRASAGFWEGDLLVGAGNRSACVVLYHRASRLALLGALTSQTAAEVGAKVCQLLNKVPEPLRQTLCWDQGRELAGWTGIETATGAKVVFCQPRSPWQKPGVENCCGLLRRWLPPNTTITNNQHQLDNIAQLLNTTPRRILDWNTPDHHYRQLVATTS